MAPGRGSPLRLAVVAAALAATAQLSAAAVAGGRGRVAALAARDRVKDKTPVKDVATLFQVAVLAAPAAAPSAAPSGAPSAAPSAAPTAAPWKGYGSIKDLTPYRDIATDYPKDDQPPHPRGVSKFVKGYPAVQDSEDFDKDYVKDENSDNGEWETQRKYDEMRHKIQPYRDRLDSAVEAHRQAQDAIDRLSSELRDLDHARREATAKEKNADEWGDRHLKNEQDYAQKVKDKMSEIEDAKRCLEQKMRELKELQDKLAKTSSEKNAAEAAEKEADAAEQDRLAEVRAKEDQIRRAQESLDNAAAAVKKYQEELDRMMAELMKAQDKLRNLRAQEDYDGGVYPTAPEHSIRKTGKTDSVQSASASASASASPSASPSASASASAPGAAPKPTISIPDFFKSAAAGRGAWLVAPLAAVLLLLGEL